MIKMVESGLIENGLSLPRLGIIDYGRRSLFDTEANAIDAINNYTVPAFQYQIYDVNMYSYPELPGFLGWQHAGNHEMEGRAYWNMFKSMFPDCILEFSDSPDMSGTIRIGQFESAFFGDFGKVGPVAFFESTLLMNPGDVWITVQGTRHVLLEATGFLPVLQKYRRNSEEYSSFEACKESIGYRSNFTFEESVEWLVQRRIWTQAKANAYLDAANVKIKPRQLYLFK